MKRKMINQIESNKIYNVEELAKLLNRTNQTILAYIKEGMPVIRNSKRFLIYGLNAKNFLLSKTKKAYKTPARDKIVCLGCNKIISMFNHPVDIISTGRQYSQEKLSIQVKGVCPDCGRAFSRFKSLMTTNKIDKGSDIPIENITTTVNHETGILALYLNHSYLEEHNG